MCLSDGRSDVSRGATRGGRTVLAISAPTSVATALILGIGTLAAGKRLGKSLLIATAVRLGQARTHERRRPLAPSPQFVGSLVRAAHLHGQQSESARRAPLPAGSWNIVRLGGGASR